MNKYIKLNYRLIFIFLAIIIFFLSSSFNGFALDPNKSLNQYVIDKWTIENDLPQNFVSSIAQTPDGYLWLATTDGLARFDGKRFKVFNSLNTPEITNNRISALYVDREGVLFIGMEYGDLIQLKAGKFRKFKIKDIPSERIIISLIEDIKGKLWIGTLGKGLNYLKDGKIYPFSFEKSRGIGRTIFSLYEDSKSNLWIGTYNGIYILKNGKFEKYIIKGFNNLNNVFSICEDYEGNLWIGTDIGLFQIKEDKVRLFTKENGLCNNFVNEIIEDKDRNIWVGTTNGVNRIKKGEKGNYIVEKFLENNLIDFIFEDHEKSIWIGTVGSGLIRLRDGKFITYTCNEGLINEHITSLCEDNRRNIWIGTPVGLMELSEGKFSSISIKDKFLNTFVNCILDDFEGNIWVGTIGKGLFQIKNGKSRNYTTNNGFISNNVRTIYKSKKGNIWIGTDKGLACYRNGVFNSYTISDGLLSNVIYNIYEDTNYDLWIGTLNGINILRDGKFIRFVPKKGNLRTTSFSMYEDIDNIIWIGTYGKGLCRLKNDEIFCITSKFGLYSNYIFHLVEDNQGNFWIYSEKGIFTVSRGGLNDLSEGRIPSIKCTSYGISDGLKSTEGGRTSVIKTFDGKIWFATFKGIAVIDPEKIKINKLQPQVIIEKIVVNGKTSLKSDAKNLFKDINEIIFYFTANTFISPEKVKFKYKLEGFDKDWKNLDSIQSRVVLYTNITPGQYSFKVIACNNDGIWNKKGDFFEFTVWEYFYEATIFKIAVVLFIALILFFILLNRKKIFNYFRLRRRYKHSTLDTKRAEKYFENLLYLMKVKKVYREDDLSLTSLAKEISISPQNLSQVINERLNKNFNDFVNAFRIEEAKMRLIDPKSRDITILEIALEVGFNSKAVFNKSFKKNTKITPSEFRKKHLSISDKNRKNNPI